MITIVDYGVGNLASIKNILTKIGVTSSIATKEADIARATKLILPGVGAFDTCVEKLQQSGFIPALYRKVKEEKVPILGICVGMQLLLESSEEGILAGLGWVKGKNIQFNPTLFKMQLKIPHMGWTDVTTNRVSPLLENMYEDPRFYFVHSYHAQLENKNDSLLTANYGYDFVAAVEHDNILGVQFHPEKSHKFGMKLLENFVKNY